MPSSSSSSSSRARFSPEKEDLGGGVRAGVVFCFRSVSIDSTGLTVKRAGRNRCCFFGGSRAGISVWSGAMLASEGLPWSRFSLSMGAMVEWLQRKL